MAEADRPITEPGTPVLDPTQEEAPPRSRRRTILMISVPLAIALVGGYFWLTAGRFVSTDNAYLKQDVVSMSPDIVGKVVSVNVRENQIVKQGDLLFKIDPASYQVALSQADASIADAQLEVAKLRTDYGTTGIDIQAAEDAVRFSSEDYKRQSALMAQGFTTKARLQQSENDLQQAEAKLRNARAAAEKARVALGTGGSAAGVYPELATARAEQAKAALDLSRTEIRAPVSGRVSQTSRLQLGSYMFNGMPALSIVANDRSWIEANFKETQLAKMRPGQPATIAFDAYPGLELKGHVESIGAGTGSQFSVLPAQNATGNWVKVTQRVPVRIAIDERSPRQLIAGLSADVTVDVRDHGGK